MGLRRLVVLLVLVHLLVSSQLVSTLARSRTLARDHRCACLDCGTSCCCTRGEAARAAGPVALRCDPHGDPKEDGTLDPALPAETLLTRTSQVRTAAPLACEG